jgi:hypothetical protein
MVDTYDITGSVLRHDFQHHVRAEKSHHPVWRQA